MNLLAQLQSTLGVQEKAIAKITQQKAENIWIGETLAGAVVLLSSDGSSDFAGKQVFFNRASGEIIGIAPDVDFTRFAV